MSDTANYYAVVTKWTKATATSPGYKSGFTLAHLLAQGDDILNTLLEDAGIPLEYFNKTIYKNWADATLAVANLGVVSAFASVAAEGNSTCYSIALYETKEVEEEVKANNPEIFETLASARNEFMKFMELNSEVKKSAMDFTDDEFFSIAVREITFTEIEEIFNRM